MINYIKKRRYAIIGTLVIIVIGIFVVFSDYGLLKRFRLELEKRDIQNEIATQNKIRDSLNLEIKMLITDSLTIEKIAREKYGMIKPGEEIYIIPNGESKK